MRVRVLAAAAVVLLCIGTAGCANWQGTSADPDLIRETSNYKDNDDPQNTGAGAGSVGKPMESTKAGANGDSPSQSAVKGTGTVSDADNLAAGVAKVPSTH